MWLVIFGEAGALQRIVFEGLEIQRGDVVEHEMKVFLKVYAGRFDRRVFNRFLMRGEHFEIAMYGHGAVENTEVLLQQCDRASFGCRFDDAHQRKI